MITKTDGGEMSNLHIGACVRILFGELAGEPSTIYNHLPSRLYPWHVRPNSWPADAPGIALRADEIEYLAPAGGESEQAAG